MNNSNNDNDNKEDNKDYLKMSQKEQRNARNAFALLTQFGIHVLVIIGACFFLGRFIDSVLKTSPIFLLGFTIFGIMSAFISVYKIAMKEINRSTSRSDYLNIDINKIKNSEKSEELEIIPKEKVEPTIDPLHQSDVERLRSKINEQRTKR